MSRTKIETDVERKVGFDDDRKVIVKAEKVKNHHSSNKRLLAKMKMAQRDLAEVMSDKKANAKKSKRGRSGRGRDTYSASPKMQRAVVRVKYAESTGTDAGAWKQQGKYVEREGANKEDEKGIGYGNEGEMHVPETLDRWQKEGDRLMWKVIVSPEFGEYMDIQKATTDAVHKIEQDLGLMKGTMEWVAIDHYNTAHPHTHLFIRGVAMNEEIEINPQYIKQGMRQRFQESITNQLGYRTERWQTLANERQVQQERFTPLDRGIAQEALENGGVFVENIVDAQNRDDPAKQGLAIAQIRRLQFLENLGLVEKTTATTYRIDPELETKLKGLGITKDRDTILEKHRKFLSMPNLELEHTSLRDAGNFIAGKVLGAGLDPATENPYLLFECVDGRAHFVLMNKKLLSERLNEKLPTGEMAIIEVKEMSVVDPSTTASKNIKFVDAKGYGKLDAALKDKQFISRVLSAEKRGKIKTIKPSKNLDQESTLGKTIGWRVGKVIEQKQIEIKKESKEQKKREKTKTEKGIGIGD